jgi:transaldolase
MKGTLFFFVVVCALGRCSSGRARADGVLCSANVPRFAPPLFRCAEHTIDASVIRAPVDRPRTSSVPIVRLIPGTPRSEIKEERSGGHSRRGVPGVSRTRPEQRRPECTRSKQTAPAKKVSALFPLARRPKSSTVRRSISFAACKSMNEDFHLYLDSADLAELQTCLPHPVVHGVTTNPTLLQRAGVGRAAVPDLLKRCIDLGARQVQAQVYSSDVDGMLEDARALLAQFDPGQLVVKIPATRQGLDAGALLIAQGVPVTWTAVYAPEQAHFAAQLGAAYAAPYLGRLEDAGVNGLALIAQMQSLVARRPSSARACWWPASARARRIFRCWGSAWAPSPFRRASLPNCSTTPPRWPPNAASWPMPRPCPTRIRTMRIALTGEALIDFTASEAGTLAFLGHEGGSPLNTAVACARLGQPTGFSHAAVDRPVRRAADGFSRTQWRGHQLHSAQQRAVDAGLCRAHAADQPLCLLHARQRRRHLGARAAAAAAGGLPLSALRLDLAAAGPGGHAHRRPGRGERRGAA